MSRTLKPAGILMSLALVISACGGSAATPVPSISAPDAESNAPASDAPSSDAPTSGEPSGSLSGDFTLWHTYSSGAGTEL
ncbi:MAG: hypothetical protein H0X20_02805, partial [Chloroflexi bacterium]|nr:hypothetical protein [Chloroflexota bacterium]